MILDTDTTTDQGNGPTAIALGAMHIAAYIPCVTLLPRLAAFRTTTLAV